MGNRICTTNCVQDPGRSIKQLSVDEVCCQVRSVSRARQISNFTTRTTVAALRRNNIDGTALSKLTEMRLEDMGIKHPEAKRLILEMAWNIKEFQRLKRMSSQAAFQVVLLN